jgi:hypothetical protein
MELTQMIIKKSFEKNKKIPPIYFDLHGSFKTNTMLRTEKKVADIDYGNYLSTPTNQTPKPIKTLLLNILQNNGYKAKNRDKLVRVHFDDGLNIDITIYYLSDKNNLPRLAREGSWMPSDPVALYNWFLQISENNNQLVRTVKYFKYWASLNRMKTPSGTAFCAWVGKHIQYNKNIDFCLAATAQSLLNSLKKGVYCQNPVKPHDNLVANLQPRHRKNFLNMLEKFVSYSDKAIATENQIIALKYWVKIFGVKLKTIELDGNTKL